jgi:ABC-type lipoprotein export system ATPase subunit
MLECRIKKKLGAFTLDVSFTAECGVTALMGASGSGKSMTLRCIAGVSKPDEGRITLDGRTLFNEERKTNLLPQKRRVGFLLQDYALFPNMTILQNIMTGANDKPRRERVRIAEALAETFHIAPHLNKYPRQLSGGERQRAALARILAAQAARLTGCKNIFELDGKHVGLRANHIVPAHLAKPGDMIFPFEVINEIEDTFTYILMVRVNGFPPIRWEMTKEKRAELRGLPQTLALPREHILLLQ